MQLPLGDDPRTETLRQLQPRLIQRFGRIERAPRERRAPEWVLVQGVIGARTRSEVSNAATDRLLARYGSWEAVAAAAAARRRVQAGVLRCVHRGAGSAVRAVLDPIRARLKKEKAEIEALGV